MLDNSLSLLELLHESEAKISELKKQVERYKDETATLKKQLSIREKKYNSGDKVSF